MECRLELIVHVTRMHVVLCGDTCSKVTCTSRELYQYIWW